jgi:hypothetical protein
MEFIAVVPPPPVQPHCYVMVYDSIGVCRCGSCLPARVVSAGAGRVCRCGSYLPVRVVSAGVSVFASGSVLAGVSVIPGVPVLAGASDLAVVSVLAGASALTVVSVLAGASALTVVSAFAATSASAGSSSFPAPGGDTKFQRRAARGVQRGRRQLEAAHSAGGPPAGHRRVGHGGPG